MLTRSGTVEELGMVMEDVLESNGTDIPSRSQVTFNHRSFQHD